MTNEMISVPRDLLAAACYCIRKRAGADSATYQQLSALSLSAVAEDQTYGGIPLSEHASSGAYGWHPGDDA